MTGNDIRGIQMLDACRRAGVAVPEEVAVVGVDNEELVCLLAYPPLSSVIPDAFRVGYESAGLLDLMMKGQRGHRNAAVDSPISVATRQSSDVTAIANPCLASAMQFIREHACAGIGVDDVLEHLASRAACSSDCSARSWDRRSWTRSLLCACSASSSCSPRPNCR